VWSSGPPVAMLVLMVLSSMIKAYRVSLVRDSKATPSETLILVVTQQETASVFPCFSRSSVARHQSKISTEIRRLALGSISRILETSSRISRISSLVLTSPSRISLTTV
jgi:hypothetical protein